MDGNVLFALFLLFNLFIGTLALFVSAALAGYLFNSFPKLARWQSIILAASIWPVIAFIIGAYLEHQAYVGAMHHGRHIRGEMIAVGSAIAVIVSFIPGLVGFICGLIGASKEIPKRK